jgi:hypothetical protein
MPGWPEFVIAGLFVVAPIAAQAQTIPVDVINASEPTKCAETDNVYVKFISRKVRHFRIEAVHPTYLSKLSADNKWSDLSNCKMSAATERKFTPRQITLYDSGKWKLVGFTYPSFWRVTQVPVRVGNKAEVGLHLLQLWTRGRSRNEEVLVLYPADGYWRARPLAPLELGWSVDPVLPTAYGSSFLVGPVEQKGRPFVDLKEIALDPDSGTFHLIFARGGAATLHVALLDESRIALDVSFTGKIAPQFAALRSMFVAADNADVAAVLWSGPDGHSHASGIMEFAKQRVLSFRAGRETPSRHNTSAPDVVFRDFR